MTFGLRGRPPTARTDLTPDTSPMYESDELLAQYLLLHYGAPDEVLPWAFGPVDALDYPMRCVSELADTAALSAGSRALDIGCAVGRSSFELARRCGTVTGIDLSTRFIATARSLAADGVVRFACPVEGLTFRELAFRVPEGIDRSRVRFETGDACALPDELDACDVVLSANLIDRLPDPAAFLNRLPGLVTPGGQLLLASPFAWMTSFTPPENWLGGTPGRPTWDILCARLDPSFDLVHTTDLPFLIREHARKYQWSVARAGRWIRRG